MPFWLVKCIEDTLFAIRKLHAKPKLKPYQAIVCRLKAVASAQSVASWSSPPASRSVSWSEALARSKESHGYDSTTNTHPKTVPKALEDFQVDLFIRLFRTSVGKFCAPLVTCGRSSQCCPTAGRDGPEIERKGYKGFLIY